MPEFFNSLIKCLNEAEISYVVLRPSGLELGSKFQEIDILVDPSERKKFTELCRTVGFYESRPNATLLLKQVFYQYKNGSIWAIDAHFSMVSKGYVYLDHQLLLDRRQYRDGGYYLSSEDELLHIAFHCILDKQHVPSKYVSLLEHYQSTRCDESYLKSHLEKFDTYSCFSSFIRDWKNFRQKTPSSERLRIQTRRKLIWRRPVNVLRRFWMATFRRVRRLVGKRGVVVAMLGPDGVGKSTLTTGLQMRFNEFRLSSTTVYMGPWGHSILPVAKVVRFIGAPGSSSKLRIPFVSQFRWLIYLCVLSVEYVARILFRVIPACRSHSVVFSDRYFYDVGAGYKKRVVRGCHGFRQLFCQLLLRPSLIVFLLASPQTIATRKDELNGSEAADFNHAYHRLAKRMNMMIVDCDRPSQDVIESVVEDIWPILFCSTQVANEHARALTQSSTRKYYDLEARFTNAKFHHPDTEKL